MELMEKETKVAKDKTFNVVKRGGQSEPLDMEKIHRVCNWAVAGVSDVSVAEIEMRANISFFDRITSADIHDALIAAAVDLVSENSPNYAKVAARLLLYKLRKETWGGKHAPTLLAHIQHNIKLGYYDPALLTEYTEHEIAKLGEYLNHSRDDRFDYGGLLQMMEKYLIQNRKTKQLHETPQFAFMGIAMAGFMYEEKSNRLKYIRRFYDDISKFRINAPTPVLAGARTPTRSWSSCCLMKVNDTKRSLFAANTTVGLATCDKYGIGIDLGDIRPINSEIKGGETLHCGVIPWLKMFQETIGACQQGGARRGAATITFPIFHPEIMTILELKNNQGTHENRVPHMDYSIGMSALFYNRLIKKQKISLFSSKDAPKVYASWGTPDFDNEYLMAEMNGTPRIEVEAEELFFKFFKERYETGRIYAINVDQANLYSPWTTPVTQSNLCQEIIHPTIAERFQDDPEAEIGCCVLAAVNMLNVRDPETHKATCEIIVRFLDNVIELQEYPVPGLKNFARNKRSLGIGITNLAAWLASQGLNHNSKEAPQLVADFVEQQQYYLMSASMELAKERGAAPHFVKQSRYLTHSPLDLYNKRVDTILDRPTSLGAEKWNELMLQIVAHGMRNMTVSAVMPCQSSAVVQNSTNGVEPITSLVIRKTSKTKTTTQVVPGITKWKNHYLKKSDILNNDGITAVNAAIQKWLCMSGSWNMYYNSSQYEDGKIPLSVFQKDHLKAVFLGLKTHYYCNALKKKDSTAEADEEESKGCASGACTL